MYERDTKNNQNKETFLSYRLLKRKYFYSILKRTQIRAMESQELKKIDTSSNPLLKHFDFITAAGIIFLLFLVAHSKKASSNKQYIVQTPRLTFYSHLKPRLPT